jgi:hypothetical protein
VLQASGNQMILDICDLTERLVRALKSDGQTAGAVAWDGTDASSHRAPAGPYFLRLRVGEEEVTRRVVLVK